MSSFLSPAQPSPPEMAAILRNRENFAWIDSPDGSGLSLMACDPDLILEGGPEEWGLLGEELEKRRLPAETGDLSAGAAIGFFRFDGSFRFGFHDHLLVHRPRIHGGAEWCGDMTAARAAVAVNPDMIPIVPSVPLIPFRPEISRGDYIAMVERAREYIAAGDIYQVCLAHRLSAEFSGDPWPLYMALRAASPAPHAAFLRLGDETILSSSPECFLRMEGRSVVTRPIKGTRPRGSTPEEDRRLEAELLASAKESAELLMITDLERNDLGRVCDFGSVRVTRLLELERHPQVFHLVSTVEGTLREGCSHVEALAACFPGGSISGAPKKRALEIIRELEPAPRGLFTGAIGYFGYGGESQFNIAIRTVTVRGGRTEFHVGAGITADSDPVREWEETLHKAAGILKAAGAAGATESAKRTSDGA